MHAVVYYRSTLHFGTVTYSYYNWHFIFHIYHIHFTLHSRVVYLACNQMDGSGTVGICSCHYRESFMLQQYSSVMGLSVYCLRAQNNLRVALNLSTRFKNVQLPTSPTTWYVGIFAVAYTSAALRHLWEFPFLLHCVWYMLGLPSGYLLLLIYSAVNLDSQSWGTREAAKPGGEGGGFKMMKKWVREGGKVVREFLQLCCGSRGPESGGNEEKVPLLQEDTESEKSAQEESGEEDADGI